MNKLKIFRDGIYLISLIGFFYGIHMFNRGDAWIGILISLVAVYLATKTFRTFK